MQQKYPLNSKYARFTRNQLSQTKASTNKTHHFNQTVASIRQSFKYQVPPETKQEKAKTLTLDMLFKDGLGDISEKAFKEFLHDNNIREQCAIHLRKSHLLPAYYVESITELLLDCSKTQFLDFRNGVLDYDSWKSEINNCWIANPERCLQQTNDVCF